MLDPRGADQFDRRFDQSRRKAEAGIQSVGATMRGFTTSLAVWNEITDSLGQFAQKIVAAALLVPRAGDAMTKNINTLTGALGDADEAAQTFDALYKGVRDLGVSLDDTITSFGSYDLALKKNGRSTAEVVDFVIGLQSAMTAFGVSGAQAASVTLQLGQALGKGKLNGDELVSLREAMPRLVDAMREALHMTDEEFAKAAEKGELTADKLIGPIFDFTRKARSDLEKLPLTMERAWAGLGTTFMRLLADLDRAFRLSERIAKAIKAVSDTLERWRAHVNTVRDFVTSLGDLNSILYTMAAALVAVAGVKLAGLALSFSLLAAKVALIVAGLLIVEDIIGWMMGKESVTGDLFGDFDDVKNRVVGLFEEMKAGVVEFWNTALSPESRAALEGLAAAFTGFFGIVIEGWKNILGGAMANWRELMAFGNWLDDLFLKLIRLVRDDLVGAFNTVTTAIGGMFSAAQKAFNFIIDAIGRLGAGNTGTTGALGDPGGSGFQLQNFGVPQPSPGAAVSPAGAVSTSQSNTIQNNVTVNATGTSGAEVAAGARQGVAAAARDMVSDLSDVARNLGISMPRAETAAA